MTASDGARTAIISPLREVVPNALTISRLFAVGGMLASAAAGSTRACLVLAAWAILSDVVDGRLARAFGVASPRGARLDSIADCALYLTAPWIGLALSPWLREHERATVVAVFIAYALPVCYGMLKFRRLTSYHTAAARIAGAAVVTGGVASLATHAAWPLRCAAVVLALSALEEIAITRASAAWRADVRSLLDLESQPNHPVADHHTKELPMQQSRSISRFRWIAVFVAAAALAAPNIARAQASIAGYLGAEFDNQNNWLLFGGEVRVPLVASPVAPWDGQLRVTYHPYGSGVSALQLDANAILPLVLAHASAFKPYVGIGAAVVHFSADDDSENKVGLNLLTGTTMDLAPGSSAFGILQTQYTLIRDYPNSYTLMVGLGLHLGGSGGGARRR